MNEFTIELDICYDYEKGRKPSLTDREDPGEPEQLTDLSIHLLGENITDMIQIHYPHVYDKIIEDAIDNGRDDTK